MNSSMLWNNKGGITADESYNKLVAKKAATADAQAEKEARREAKAAAQEQARLGAAQAPDIVRSMVQQQGWKTGRGGLTKTLLCQVVIWFNQRVAQADKVADLVTRVQALMGWNEEHGFPHNLSSNIPAGPQVQPAPQ